MGRIGLNRERVNLHSCEETLAFGRKMGETLPRNAVIALSGDLGAGKTTFVQGLAQGLGIMERVQSPTFVILNVYEGLYHFDLYRLKSAEEFVGLGFEEYFHKEGICAIEWPDRIGQILPPETIHIHFSYDQNGRVVNIL